MKVEVRPLPSAKWHGKKGGESFSLPKAIEVLYDTATGRYATGLTPEEAKEYGALTGNDLSDTFNANEPHVFWSTKPATTYLPNNTVIYDTERPVDYVRVKNLKASKYVANSQREYEEGKWPEATHVIFDEKEEVNLKASKIAIKNEARVLTTKMSGEDKANMVQILSKKSVKGRSVDFIDVEIDAIIEENAADFLKYANMGREEVAVRAQVLELVARNILTKEANAFFYMGEQIAMDYESTVEWFKSPQNSKMKVVILEKLNK